MVGYFRLGIYETLYFMQKNNFFNLVFYFQTFTSFFTNLSLAVNYDFAWDLKFARWPEHSFQSIIINAFLTLTLHEWRRQIFDLIFLLALLHVAVTITMGVYIAFGLIKGTFKRTWIATLFRSMLGFCATFYDAYLRIFLTVLDCNYFSLPYYEGTLAKEASDFNIKACHTNTIVTVQFIAAVIIMSLFSFLIIAGSIAHLNDPCSFSAVARPHSIMDLCKYITCVNFLRTRAHTPPCHATPRHATPRNVCTHS